MPGFVSHVERLWEHPACRASLASLMPLGRLILFDRRGVGLSDRVGSTPSVEATAEDIGTVLRAAKTRRAVLFGSSEAGPACIKLAVERTPARGWPHSVWIDGEGLLGAGLSACVAGSPI